MESLIKRYKLFFALVFLNLLIFTFLILFHYLLVKRSDKFSQKLKKQQISATKLLQKIKHDDFFRKSELYFPLLKQNVNSLHKKHFKLFQFEHTILSFILVNWQKWLDEQIGGLNFCFYNIHNIFNENFFSQNVSLNNKLRMLEQNLHHYVVGLETVKKNHVTKHKYFEKNVALGKIICIILLFLLCSMLLLWVAKPAIKKIKKLRANLCSKEQNLAQNIFYLRNFFKDVPAIVWSVDTFGRLIHLDGKELTSLGLNKFLVSELSIHDKEFQDFGFMGNLLDYKQVFKGEAINKHIKFSKKINFKFFLNPIFDKNSKIIGASGLAIKKRVVLQKESYKNKEEKINEKFYKKNRTLNKQLEQVLKQSKIKDNFIANLSHELRTPLNSIIGMKQIMEEEITGQLNSEQKKSLEIIHNSAQHVLCVINDILDYSKINAGKMGLNKEELQVETICRSALKMVTPIAKKNSIKLQFKFDQQNPQKILGDPVRLKQIFLNLLSNALKFTPKNGIVSLNVYSEKNQEQNYIVFEIRDSGKGIPKEKIASLFKPFEQIKREIGDDNQHGTGLGLALVKHFTELHGGKIQVSSKISKGSSFKIKIPLTIKQTNSTISINDDIRSNIEYFPKLEAKKLIKTTQNDKIHCLIVEDNLSNQIILDKYLSSKGIKISICSNGVETINFIKEKALPDIILLDIYMPEMDGLRTIQELKKISPQIMKIPIIFCSGMATEKDKKQGMQAGAIDYITKPYDLQEVLKKINQYSKANIN